MGNRTPAAVRADGTESRERPVQIAQSPPEGKPVRPVIDASWRRVRREGLDPGQGTESEPLDADALEWRRRDTALRDVLPTLGQGLGLVAESAGQVMVVADAEGRVLWRSGHSRVLRLADSISLAEGAAWAEESTGTNAIGTALATESAVHVHGHEHYVRVLHRWTCAASPVHDPRDGRLLGAVDLSGPQSSFHPAALALVDSVARLAESSLRLRHLESVERLRSVAAPILWSVGGRAVAVDRHGWVAGVTELAPFDRVPLPPEMPGNGRLRVPALGECAVEPLPGGWLLRPVELPGLDAGGTSGRIVLDLSVPRRASVQVSGPAGSWAGDLSPRHAELLYALAVHREGRSAAQLARDLFGDPSRTVTVRAELSRVRRTLRGVLEHRPYRFREGYEIELRTPRVPADLLPHSAAPVVRAGRGEGV